MHIALSMVLENIDFFAQPTEKLDKAIDRGMRVIPNPLVTLPRIGPMISVGIEIGLSTPATSVFKEH